MLPLLFPPWSLVLLLMNPFAFTSSCFFFSFCVSLSQTQHHQHQQHRRHYQPQYHSISLPGISKSFVFFVCFSLCASLCVLLIIFCFSSVGFLGSGVSRVGSSIAAQHQASTSTSASASISTSASASQQQHQSFSITASASQLQHHSFSIRDQRFSISNTIHIRLRLSSISTTVRLLLLRLPSCSMCHIIRACCICYIYTHTYTIHAYCLLFHRKTRIWFLCSIYSRTPVECTCFYAFLCVFNSAVCFYVFLMSWH
jgi:hypothetical protein